jgi:hypothetical protein
MHWVEVQQRTKESQNGGPTEEDKALVRATYHLHEHELGNPESRRLFEAQAPKLDQVQQGLLGLLQRDGFAAVPFTKLLDRGLWQRLEADSAAFTERAVRELEGDPGKERKPGKELSPEKLAKLKAKAAKKNAAQVQRFKDGDVMVESPWFEFASSPRILDVVNTYLGLWAKVSYIDEWYDPVSAGEEGIESQRWHRGPDDLRPIKAFLYMGDVEKGGGPLEYIRGSALGSPFDSEWPWEPLGEPYPPADEFAARIPLSAARTMTAPRGTLILCDTSGFHRGGFCKSRPRVMGVVDYVSPAALAALVQRNFRIDPGSLPPTLSDAGRYAFT